MKYSLIILTMILYSCSNRECSKTLNYLHLKDSKLNCECIQFIDSKYTEYNESKPLDSDYSSQYEAVVTDSTCQTKLLSFLKKEGTWKKGPLTPSLLYDLDIQDAILTSNHVYYSVEYLPTPRGGACYWYKITYYDLTSNRIKHKEFSL